MTVNYLQGSVASAKRETRVLTTAQTRKKRQKTSKKSSCEDQGHTKVEKRKRTQIKSKSGMSLTKCSSLCFAPELQCKPH